MRTRLSHIELDFVGHKGGSIRCAQRGMAFVSRTNRGICCRLPKTLTPKGAGSPPQPRRAIGMVAVPSDVHGGFAPRARHPAHLRRALNRHLHLRAPKRRQTNQL
jgi:hypothetical protein